MPNDDAGELRNLLTFQRFTGNRDALGDPLYHRDEQWETVMTIHGGLRDLSSGEFYRAAQSESYITHTIKIRYRADVRSDMRVKLGTRVFRIEAPPIDLTGTRQWMQLKVRELVP